MAQGGKKAFLIVVAVIVVALGALSMTGFFVVNPITTVPKGETIWYYRRGTGLPFVSSADGLNVKRGTGVTPESRSATNATIAQIIGKRVISKFDYANSLYLYSTGNKDFSVIGAPQKTQAAPGSATPAAPATP
jgi:hypothetical protein